MCRLLLIFAALALVSSVASSPLVSQEHKSSRNNRGYFTFITIATETCDTGDAANPHGTCLASKDCRNLEGTVKTKCAQGLGVCCYLTKSCGKTITTNLTSFVNPSHPSVDNTATRCVTEVKLMNKNVCQLRLDFVKFNINGPNQASGECDQDFFMVTRTTTDSRVPKLCGQNKGQHMYVDVDPNGGNPQLTMDLSTASYSREWEIKVTQIECDSRERAPSGCLQYHNTTAGTVTSFNYVAATGDQIAAGTTVTPHLANLDYRVCIAPQPGFCEIDWSTSSTTGFAMTGALVGSTASLIGTPDAGWTTSDEALACADYVVIPGGVYDTFTYADGTSETSGNRDRYCGSYFPDVTSTLQPFLLHVVTDGSEPAATDSGNVGFSLSYRMTSC